MPISKTDMPKMVSTDGKMFIHFDTESMPNAPAHSDSVIAAMVNTKLNTLDSTDHSAQLGLMQGAGEKSIMVVINNKGDIQKVFTGSFTPAQMPAGEMGEYNAMTRMIDFTAASPKVERLDNPLMLSSRMAENSASADRIQMLLNSGAYGIPQQSEKPAAQVTKPLDRNMSAALEQFTAPANKNTNAPNVDISNLGGLSNSSVKSKLVAGTKSPTP